MIGRKNAKETTVNTTGIVTATLVASLLWPTAAFAAAPEGAAHNILAPASVTSAQMATAANPLSAERALAIALDDAGLKKAQVALIEVERDGRAYEVEFALNSGKAEYEYEIATSDGQIISKDVDYAYRHTTSKKKVGEKAALKAVAKLTGVKKSVVNNAKITYKYKKGEGKYKVKFRNKGYEHECEVLAANGKVIEWEMERLGK